MLDISKIKSIKAFRWINYTIIFFLIFIVYSSSLLHRPRGDQVFYLAEVAQKSSLWDLTIGSMDLNRHRKFDAGDQILFRPGVYLILGVEKYFFGYNAIYWQALGIILHAVVIWVLLDLLLLIHFGWEAVCASALFALLFVNIEMVIWHHIHSYLFSVICILMVLKHVYLLINKTDKFQKHYLSISMWLLLGAFTFEVVNGIALLVGIFLWKLKPQQRQWTLLIFGVPCVYLLASFLNYYLHPCSISLQTHKNIGAFLHDGLIILANWLYIGLFPFELQWLYGERTVIAPHQLTSIKPLHVYSFPTAIALGFICTYVFTYLKYAWRLNNPRKWFALMVLSFTVILATFIDIGRAGEHLVLEVLSMNTYYMYIFWILIFVSLYTLVDWRLVRKEVKVSLCIFMMTFMIINGYNVSRANDWRTEEIIKVNGANPH